MSLCSVFYRRMFWRFQQEEICEVILCCLHPLRDKSKTLTINLLVTFDTELWLSLQYKGCHKVCFRSSKINIFGHTSQMPLHQPFFSEQFLPVLEWMRISSAIALQRLNFCNGCKSRLVVLNKQILVPSQLSWSTIIGSRLMWCGQASWNCRQPP